MATYNGDGGNNTLVGSSNGDFMQGGGGNDTIQGGGGNDTIGGNEGIDWLAGGAGNDTVSGGSGQDSFAFAEYGAANADVLTDFDTGWDNLQLDAAAFAQIGATGRFFAGDARFYAAAGATGGHDADDRIVYNTTTGQIFYDADGNGAGAAQLIGTIQSGSSLSATDIWVYGQSAPSPSGQTIRGTSGDDHLVGDAGNDTLNGLAGTDTLEGGAGDDTYINGEVIIDTGGIDTVIFGPNGGTLGADLENAIVRGNSTAPERDITGNELANRITNEATGDTFFYLTGGGGDDTLIGGGNGEAFVFDTNSDYGHDTVDGGAGFDWLLFGGRGAVSVDFRNGSASGVSFTNIDAAQGGSGNDALIADDAGRQLLGAYGNDSLTGGAGADFLLGDGVFSAPAAAVGNDTLEGGAGHDTLGGGDGADLFRFAAAPGAANADVVTDFVSGTDRLELDGRVMTALGSSGALSTGDARFYAGAGAHDADDRIVYNTTTGELSYDADGSGASTAQLIATLQGAPSLSATDITVANGSSTQPPAAGQNLSGTSGNDTLVGGTDNDTIYGNSGNDWIEGRGGNDRLSGGSGQDSYVFREFGTANADTLANFDGNSWDSLRLDNAAFTALGADGRFTAGDARFYAAAGATSGHDADDRIVYNTSSGELYYDADGNGAGGAELVATLAAGSTLIASDLWVI
jgi:Ca2+-binding RTX toxin-like protein